MDEARLCAVAFYAECYSAYFTTLPISEQRGDDWNDAPLECNGTSPFTYSLHDHRAGRPTWEIFCVWFSGSFNSPNAHRECWEELSIDDVNAGAAPWLTSSDGTQIWAGATIAQFEQFVINAGGRIGQVKQEWGYHHNV